MLLVFKLPAQFYLWTTHARHWKYTHIHTHTVRDFDVVKND
jgi:hypothetical protein